MNTDFDRHRAQLRCEAFLNCTTLDQWNLAQFKDIVLTKAQAYTLAQELHEDAIDLYFKGLLSLFEALYSVSERRLSWATVKAYYSLYYFLRSTMAVNGVALIRQKSLFYLRAIEGQSPVKKSPKRYNTDHSGTINFFIDLFSSDLLLSQNIDSTNAYDWLMVKREQINYRERVFNEPSCSSFWEAIFSEVRAGRFGSLLDRYVKDPFVLCFQEEHAVLAIPIKRALLTKQRIVAEGLTVNFSGGQRTFLRDLLPVSLTELEELTHS